jgi:hypothetical protein
MAGTGGAARGDSDSDAVADFRAERGDSDTV